MPKRECKCSTGVRALRESLPKFNWYEIMSFVAFHFYTKDFSNPYVYIHLQEDRCNVAVDLKYDNLIFGINITLVDKVVFPPETSVEEDSGVIFIKFEKVNKRIWGTYGTMKNRILNQLKPITYHVAKKVHCVKNQYVYCLQTKEMIYTILPFGYSMKFSGTTNDGEHTSRFFSNLPFIKELNPYYNLVVEVMKGHNTVPLVLVLNSTGSFTQTFDIGKELVVSDMTKNFDYDLVAPHTRVLLMAHENGIVTILGIIRFLLFRKNVTLIHLMWYVTELENAFCWTNLEQLDSADSRFRSSLFVERPDSNWTGPSGYVESSDLLQFFPPALDDPITFALIFGDSEFKDKCFELLQQLGMTKESIFVSSYVDHL